MPSPLLTRSSTVDPIPTISRNVVVGQLQRAMPGSGLAARLIQLESPRLGRAEFEAEVSSFQRAGGGVLRPPELRVLQSFQGFFDNAASPLGAQATSDSTVVVDWDAPSRSHLEVPPENPLLAPSYVALRDSVSNAMPSWRCRALEIGMGAETFSAVQAADLLALIPDEDKRFEVLLPLAMRVRDPANAALLLQTFEERSIRARASKCLQNLDALTEAASDLREADFAELRLRVAREMPSHRLSAVQSNMSPRLTAIQAVDLLLLVLDESARRDVLLPLAMRVSDSANLPILLETSGTSSRMERLEDVDALTDAAADLREADFAELRLRVAREMPSYRLSALQANMPPRLSAIQAVDLSMLLPTDDARHRALLSLAIRVTDTPQRALLAQAFQDTSNRDRTSMRLKGIEALQESASDLHNTPFLKVRAAVAREMPSRRLSALEKAMGMSVFSALQAADLLTLLPDDSARNAVLQPLAARVIDRDNLRWLAVSFDLPGARSAAQARLA